jgi:glucose dehydrogenase
MKNLLLIVSMFFSLSGCSDKNEDWSSYGKDLTNQRYSKLQQINEKNVQNLSEDWSFRTGVKATFQATPIVHNGVMFVSLPFNGVVALDGKTGKELWRYEHDLTPEWEMCCGPSNRGVAIHENQLFFGTVDARLISLNIKTGAKIWDKKVVGNQVKTESISSLDRSDTNRKKRVTGGTGVGISMAPVVYKNQVIIGITGVGYGLHLEKEGSNTSLGSVVGLSGRFGRSGFLAAYDISTGEQKWQFNTIPPKGWEGKFTNYTEDGTVLNRDIYYEKQNLDLYPDASKFGGGSAWTTPAIDKVTDTLFFGTGNPSPQMSSETRPGDNLYTVSLIALDANTGKLKWHYQQVPHDIWGYDVASPPVLFYTIHKDKVIPAIGQAGKTGWFYIHHRNTGELLLKSDPFVPQSNLFTNASKEGTVIYPGILGGSNWSPVSLNTDKNLAFISGIHAPIKYTLHEKITNDKILKYTSSEPTNDSQWGLLSAINLSNGKIVWQHRTDQPLLGGTLATKGDLVFSGEGNGNFNAFNSQTGELLWQTKVEAGVNAPPITYMIDGRQYIAVAAGGNKIMGFTQGDFINVYSLPYTN